MINLMEVKACLKKKAKDIKKEVVRKEPRLRLESREKKELDRRLMSRMTRSLVVYDLG